MGLLENLVNGAAAIIGLKEPSSLPIDTDYYDDPDLNLAGNQNARYWRRITQSASDLSPLTQERQAQIALHLFDRNPLAKRILEVVKDYVIGEGIDVDTGDEALRKQIDRFWNDGQNDMDRRVHVLTTELGLYGEQALAVFVNDGSGAVRVVSIDPRSIVAVLPTPGNPDVAYAIGLQAKNAVDDTHYLKVIREDDKPDSPTFGELVGAALDEPLRLSETQTAQYYQPAGLAPGVRLVGCFYVAVNKVQSATRGRSDLLCIADFLDLYDRLIFDEAERMSMLRAFVWDVTVKGNG